MSVLRHAAWAVDELPPAEAVRAARRAAAFARLPTQLKYTQIEAAQQVGPEVSHNPNV